MKKDLRIKHYGVNEKGMIFFFCGRQRSHRYYRSIISELAENGYLVLAIPYGAANIVDRIDDVLVNLNITEDHVILMSHASGDEKIYWYSRVTSLIIDKMIITSPTRSVIHYKDTPTLVLWSNKYKANIALDLFVFARKRTNYHFIGYPNCSRYLFAGVGYSQFHDKYNKKPKKTFFDVDKYAHIEQDVMTDIYLFLEKGEVKEKIAIFSENYLPFSSGVNILTNVLKTELEKEGKKVYPVTYKLKHVDYTDINQDKNVVVFPCVRAPGKNNHKEEVLLSIRYAHMMKHLRAYQFDYIQLQTEFTIGVAGQMLKRIDDIPMVYTAHTMWNDMINKRYPKWLAKIINAIFNRFLIPPLKYANLMTVPTEKVKKFYMEEWKKEEPIVVIPGCVDGANFAMNDEDYEQLNKLRDNYQLKDKIVLGYIGRISKEKNIAQVVEYFEKAAADYPNLVLMVVGDGPYLDNLNEKARTSKYADRMIVVGSVQNNKLKYYYRLFNAFCTASTFETQGLTYVEAMWCKTPLLVRYDHCLDHFLSSGKNGITFEDYDTFKDGLNKIISDKEYVNSLVEEGYKTALTYAKDVWAKKMYFLYTQAKLFNEGKIEEFDYKTFKEIK